jgi:hypothetical protein
VLRLTSGQMHDPHLNWSRPWGGLLTSSYGCQAARAHSIWPARSRRKTGRDTRCLRQRSASGQLFPLARLRAMYALAGS